MMNEIEMSITVTRHEPEENATIEFVVSRPMVTGDGSDYTESSTFRLCGLLSGESSEHVIGILSLEDFLPLLAEWFARVNSPAPTDQSGADRPAESEDE